MVHQHDPDRSKKLGVLSRIASIRNAVMGLGSAIEKQRESTAESTDKLVAALGDLAKVQRRAAEETAALWRRANFIAWLLAFAAVFQVVAAFVR